jgi:hypothetical protein
MNQPEGDMAVNETEAGDDVVARYATEDMQEIAAGLTARGLTASLNDARVGLDLSASRNPSRLQAPEFWMNEDGYAEVHYWNPPGTAPAQVTAMALRVLETVGAVPADAGDTHSQ